jgi:hypothetical protein
MRVRTRSGVMGARMPGAVGQQLRRLASWAVASSLGAAIGCTDPAGPGTGQAGASAPFTAADWIMPCDSLLLAAHPIMATRELDYFGVVGPKYAGLSMLISDYGNACDGASDRGACLEKLSRFVNDTSQCIPPGPCKSFTVLTRGDRVERQTELAQLRAVLGDIDTPSEATVVAMAQGLMLACSRDVNSVVENPGTEVHSTESGYRVESLWNSCGVSEGQQAIDVHRDGTAGKLESTKFVRSNCAIGRRPHGLSLARVPSHCEPLGRFLAEAAQLEAASVLAFERLGLQLQQLGAAEPLVSATRRSADDERRHAWLTAALARSYGGAVFAPNVPASGSRPTALAVALENATEGCVRETFGALVAWHQAALARDERVAEVMGSIAADETRHAELSWSIAAWLEPQLTSSERAMVFAARETAVRELEREIAGDSMPETAREVLGLPPASLQTTLLDRMSGQLGLG